DAWHDDPHEAQLSREIGRVQSGGAAKRKQGETPRINATPNRNEAHSLGHIRVDDAMDAARRGEPVDAEPGGDTVDGALGQALVETARAAEKIRRVEIAEHKVGVGDGWLGAALAVAGRPRRGAGAFRPDMQDAAGINPSDRAAAGADRGDVEAAQRDPVAGDLTVHGERRL